MYLALGAGFFLFALIYANIASGFITSVVGFIYPAYQSFLALETPQKDDDVQWLTYWIVFGLFSILEYFSDVILYWLPLYYLFKLVGLIYLFAPQTKVSQALLRSSYGLVTAT